MRGTPRRVFDYWVEMSQGLVEDASAPLDITFVSNFDQIVLIKDIAFTSYCEHHLLPFQGVAHAAYIPNGKVVGLSKIPRALDVLAKRPQIQERLTHQFADLLFRHLRPLGVVVVLEAQHTCMSARGVNKPGSTTVTSFVDGVFRNDSSARAEAMALIRG